MDQHTVVVGSWWTSAAGGAMSAWSWFTSGMNPLAILLAVLTVILTVIKIAQEVRAWRGESAERTAMQKILARLTRRSSFDKFDSRASQESRP